MIPFIVRYIKLKSWTFFNVRAFIRSVFYAQEDWDSKIRFDPQK